MRLLIFLFSVCSVGCANTPTLYSPELEIAQHIYNADKIDVVFIGKNQSYSATTSSWPETFQFLGRSIKSEAQRGH